MLLRTLFGQDVQRREDLIRRIQTELSHGFRFVADCFGEGQEMILLVSALTRTPNALTYIGRHGCEPYLHYAQRSCTGSRKLPCSKPAGKCCNENRGCLFNGWS